MHKVGETTCIIIKAGYPILLVGGLGNKANFKVH
jgi:hypothetical protein